MIMTPPWTSTMNRHINYYMNHTGPVTFTNRFAHPKGPHEKSTSKYSMPGSASAWHFSTTVSYRQHDTQISDSCGLGLLSKHSSVDITNITEHDGQNPAPVYSNPSRLDQIQFVFHCSYDQLLIHCIVNQFNLITYTSFSHWKTGKVDAAGK